MVHFKWVTCTICELYLNKAGFFFKEKESFSDLVLLLLLKINEKFWCYSIVFNQLAILATFSSVEKKPVLCLCHQKRIYSYI